MDSEDADEENQSENGSTLLHIFERGYVLLAKGGSANLVVMPFKTAEDTIQISLGKRSDLPPPFAPVCSPLLATAGTFWGTAY